jgi:hypothetical protein
MISAKHIIEAYLDTITPVQDEQDKTTSGVLVNPDESELRELVQSSNLIKFIGVHSEQKIYLWDGEKTFREDLWSSVMSWLGIPNKGGLALGELRPKDGKLHIALSQTDKKNIDKWYPGLVNYDWSWTHKYEVYLELELSLKK